jgi:hypothetical protein
MYWRVRTISANDLLKKYGVHIALIVSIFLNVILALTRPNPNAGVIKNAQQNFKPFAETVTRQLLDSSYISYEQSTNALARSGELAREVVVQLQKQDKLPKTLDEIKATVRTLTEQKQVSAVRIDSVSPGEPNAKGLIPMEVTGVVAIHSAEESGPTDPVPFRFRYLLGFRQNPDEPNNPNSQLPIVAAFSE